MEEEDDIVNVCIIDRVTLIVVNVGVFYRNGIFPDDEQYYYRIVVGPEWMHWTYNPETGEYTPPPYEPPIWHR